MIRFEHLELYLLRPDRSREWIESAEITEQYAQMLADLYGCPVLAVRTSDRLTQWKVQPRENK